MMASSSGSSTSSQPYQVIARKYRPQTFSELVSQEHVRTTIENAITKRRIAHGYIFAGQRGTGKTTVARILARCLNCAEGPTIAPCGVCSSCVEITQGGAMDVIEIDAASNRGINEMRELRENVRFRPARDRYKVFIIDEAHQITNEAFNALLKTLEEPPEWVVFILCTTESHKIPVTIASRCQQFSFRSVDFDDLVARMRWICGEEGIQAEEEALAVLAQAGEGSVRDSLSALDQAIACCGATLQAKDVRELLGLFSLDSLGTAAQALKDGDSGTMLDIVMELERNGRSLQHYCRELARYFRNLLVKKIAPANTRLIAASPAEQARMAEVSAWFSEEDLTRYLQITLDLFKDLQTALQPRLHMELGLLRLIHAGKLMSIEEAIASMGSGGGGGSSKPPMQTPPRQAPPPPPTSSGPRFSPPASSSMQPSAPAISRPVASAPPPPPPAAPAAAPAVAPMVEGDWRSRLYAGLHQLKLPHTADAIEQSSIVEQNGQLLITVPNRLHEMTIKGDLPGVIDQIAGRPMKIQVKIGQVASSASLSASAPSAGSGGSAGGSRSADEEEVRQRALSHPDVQKFQQMFPEGQVRQVRNLKE
jgi:DNA polymerase-3 subunit gamma/tau